MTDSQQQTQATEYDVAIMGAGQAGLTLALQMKQARPETSIVVIEKQRFPVPEAAHKVGESTVEISGHYLRDVLGLEEHLQTQQLRKFGLRMFFSTGDNQDITRRIELGHAVLPPPIVGTYQLDRGRFENALSQMLPERGITLLDGTKVQQLDLRPRSETHHLRLDGEQGAREINVKWVVDATGRSSLLKRQLGLAKKVDHHANSAWFRVNYPVSVNDWSNDPEWRGRIKQGDRRLSTNHLMGQGYWIWLIPLASNSTSIGIVADANMHPFEGFNLFERALNWLHEHEPQLAQTVEEHREQIQDFRVMRDYSYSCEQLYSDERWCLTGEAGISLDPLYSPGGDLIAISNGLVCDMVSKYLDGEDVEDLAATHNQLMLLFTTSWLSTYEKQYSLMGNAQIMVAKVFWDTAVYWAIPGLLYFHDKLRTFSDSPTIPFDLLRFSVLSEHVQAFFRDWLAFAQQDASDGFIRYYDYQFTSDLHIGMTAEIADDEFDTRFAANVRFIERLAGKLIKTAIQDCLERSDSEEVRNQVARWQEDPFLQELITLYDAEAETAPIEGGWVTLGRVLQEKQEVVR
ncbi:NAD(P)/FAD-dependent oxidoreductase [Ktedonospora formicarum]|uniref:Halogenase n=1 Tax=Ktedonospora formicarum TaxID=2778364 RepID=A0A8J3I719_9CHLR|nr:NAD(P)/FAD-dependent oxidoreductase [Ktedonospora formicarum]GHO48030.1 halogenase [Ktedonospora formicarum]